MRADVSDKPKLYYVDCELTTFRGTIYTRRMPRVKKPLSNAQTTQISLHNSSWVSSCPKMSSYQGERSCMSPQFFLRGFVIRLKDLSRDEFFLQTFNFIQGT